MNSTFLSIALVLATIIVLGRQPESSTGRVSLKKWGIPIAVTLSVVVLLVTGIYLILEDAGAFSQSKCEARGGTWDPGIEICKSNG